MSQIPDNIRDHDLRRFWRTYFGINITLSVIATILMLINLGYIIRVNSQGIAQLQQEEILEDSEVTLRELADVIGRIEASENRALNYLGIFESIAFGVSVFSIVLVGLGFAGAAVGVSNFNELRRQLEDARRELQTTEQQLNQRINQQLQKLEHDKLDMEDIQKRSRDHEMERTMRIAEQLKQSENAVHELQVSIQNRMATVLQSNRQAWTLISLAERDLRQGNIESALRTFERAYHLDEDNPLPSYYLGYIALNTKQEEHAKEYFEKAIAIDGEFHRAVAALGFTLRRIGEKQEDPQVIADYFKKAEQLLTKALGNDPFLVDFEGESWHGSLAGLYRRTNRLDDAIHHYRQARKVTPLSSYPTGNLARIAIQTNAKGTEINVLYTDMYRLARLEISSDINNYWAQADVLIAMLVLGHDLDEIWQTFHNLLDAIPELVSDVLPRVLETIEDVKNALPYEEDKRDENVILSVIQRLQQEINDELRTGSSA